MQVLRTESLLALSELKAIADQRVADEYASVIRTRELAERQEREAELAAIAADEARANAERAAAAELARLRADAEREAWLRVEAADADERARHAAALEAQRLDFERELCRELARRVRPRWMIAATCASLVVAALAAGFAIQGQRAITDATDATSAAERTTATATDGLAAAVARCERFELDLVGLAGRLESAVNRLDKQQHDADVRVAEQEKRDRDAAAWQRKRDQDKHDREVWEEERRHGLHPSAACINNGVCKEVTEPKHPAKK